MRKIKFHIQGEDDYWPGPKWEPVIYHAYPQMGGSPGDIYVNELHSPFLYYIFYTKGHCEPVRVEDILEWEQSGLMSLHQSDHLSIM